MSDAAASDGLHPCVGCGLCCNGVLYRRARAEPHEHDMLTAAGLVLEPDGDNTYFILPCRFESCGRCTIYNDRFTICHEFKCALLRQVDSGEVSAATACATVAQAKLLVEKVQSLDVGAEYYVDRLQLRRSLADEIRNQTGEARHQMGQRLLAMATLDMFLDRWFRNKKGGEDPS